MIINKDFTDQLLEQAKNDPCGRVHCDLRNSGNDNSQRILIALQPGTIVPRHRHPNSSETFFVLRGCLDEVYYDDEGDEIERHRLCSQTGEVGIVVPKNTWHSFEVFEPSVVFDAKDGKFGEDGTERIIE